MKFRYVIMFLVLAITGAGIFTSCSDDDTGTPMISYVRITRPASSDSLLAAAGQGQMIAIMGQNLQHTVQLWFNDQRATLNATFITSTSIIVRVPSQIPEVVSNKLKLVFSNGKELIYDFTVDISEPFVSRMRCEYVNVGDVATFYGNYFYAPISVVFTGDVEGEIVSLDDDIMEVRVPSGVQPGPITITNNFGVTESDFWFRDNRNIIASFDGTTNGLWHGPSHIVSSDPDISPVNGKFIRMKNNLGAWGWFELYVGPSDSDVALELKNIPEEAFTRPDRYSLKFELNTLESLTGANVHMYIGPSIEPGRHSAKYIWQPNVHTNGEWETITIPWEPVLNANTELVYNPDGYGTSIHFSGPNPVTGNFALDNMRVVPNTND